MGTNEALANQKQENIFIVSEYITLGQFLKFAKIIGEGGEAKGFLSTHKVLVNGEEDNRRGRKLRGGDSVLIEGKAYLISKK